MPWWYPFGCIAFIVGGILIFLKPEWLWALTEQWKSYAADGPSDFYILSTASEVRQLLSQKRR